MRWKADRHAEDGGQCIEYRDACRWDTPHGSERSYFNPTLNFSVDVIGYGQRTPSKAAPAGLTDDELEAWPIADNIHAASCRELLRRLALERSWRLGHHDTIREFQERIAKLEESMESLKRRGVSTEVERGATVLWLRGLVDQWSLGSQSHVVSVLNDAANAIERGRHRQEVRV